MDQAQFVTPIKAGSREQLNESSTGGSRDRGLSNNVSTAFRSQADNTRSRLTKLLHNPTGFTLFAHCWAGEKRPKWGERAHESLTIALFFGFAVCVGLSRRV